MRSVTTIEKTLFVRIVLIMKEEWHAYAARLAQPQDSIWKLEGWLSGLKRQS